MLEAREGKVNKCNSLKLNVACSVQIDTTGILLSLRLYHIFQIEKLSQKC